MDLRKQDISFTKAGIIQGDAMKKLQPLEGLRGIAAFAVVVFHFLGLFYPPLRIPDEHSNKLVQFIAKSPLNVFYSGSFAVSVFFVLSGFVLSYKFFKTKDREIIISTALKRYLRLAIPITFSILIVYICSKIYPGYAFSAAQDPKILAALYEGLIRCFLAPSTKYNPVIWTMHYELLGSFMVFGFCLIFGGRRNRIFGYLFVMIFFWSTYYFSFLTGILLSDLHVSYGNYIKNRYLKVLLLSLALFLGSYPALYDPKIISTTIYSFLSFNSVKNIFIIYQSTGATLLLMVLMNSATLSKLFSFRVFSFMGKISFSVYLLHLIVFEYFSLSLFGYIQKEFFFPKKVDIGLTFLISLFVIVVASFLTTKYIDQSAVKFANYVYNGLFSGNEKNNIADFNFVKNDRKNENLFSDN
jgi:peptidoglycan/LPS O-acetylase OafA/YrhL